MCNYCNDNLFSIYMYSKDNEEPLKRCIHYLIDKVIIKQMLPT